MVSNNARESLGSRLGFLLISAGCAIGLGNVWRFPFITGMYGGAAFVLVYLFFLLFFALPILVMEFSVGRAARLNSAGAFRKLEPAGSRWHYFGLVGLVGNYLLMMFYTTVSGWMLAYVWHFISGSLGGLDPDGVAAFFGDFLADPFALVGWMALCVLLGFAVCGMGLKRGVERVSIVVMSGLFLILILLVLRSVSLPGAAEGLAFYLLPDFGRMLEKGLWVSIYAAMGQAFFTLSIGIGSMAIFGSYISRDRSLTGESVSIMALDTSVAILSGLIIFPACFAFGVDVGAGPGLRVVTLHNGVIGMAGGRFWGTLFFLFMSFAALSTVIAVFENLVSYGIDIRGWSRKKSVCINFLVVLIASLPCALGFNVLSGIQPLGAGSGILDLEDFIVSNNLLPIGALVYLLFCTCRYGWGWDNFIAEADAGAGLKFPRALRFYVSCVLPVLILIVLVQGYIDKFL
ncbi:MAG: sodium-dependent transporter [Candidatus Accumulibacter sp.]|jgi:NSS family neurotransmitter:Na+ symporter|nr:sodium-dependent transporter [Accumulibacter sp.]